MKYKPLYNYIKPFEIQYDSTGTYLVKGGIYECFIRPLFRKYVLKKKEYFWTHAKGTRKSN